MNESEERQKRLEESLDSLRGNRERFRALLEDRDAILARICRNVELIAKRKKTEPWAIMGQLTGHGSGVSAAIFHTYRLPEKENER